MRTASLAVIILLVLGCTRWSVEREAGAGSSNSQKSPLLFQTGRPVYLSQQATWQLFYLPKDWIERHLEGPAPVRAYVALVPPHREDLEADYSPCSPPSRIVLGVVGADGSIRETLVACVYYCEPGDRPGSVYRDLWGALTHIEGITVQILEDGSIDVIEHFRKRGFVSPNVEEDTRIVDKLCYEGSAKIRHHRIMPSDFVFQEKSAGSCIGLEE